LREERRLRVFENRVLRRIFGPDRDEVTGEWRKLHNEKLNDLYCSPNIDYSRIRNDQLTTTDDTTTIRHTGQVTTHYMIYHPFDLYFK
jgi:hypothetical protein